MDENKVIVSTEMKQTLVNLRNLEEIYVIMSGVTKMPFVLCDEETFDDEVLVYYQEESAKEKAKTLAEDRYHVGIAKIEKNARLGFFTNLYTMGVNALAVNVGTEEEIRIQLEHLVVRKNKEELPEGKKLIENPELHLTAMYLMQEMHRSIGPEMPENVKTAAIPADKIPEILIPDAKGVAINPFGVNVRLDITKANKQKPEA